MQGDLQNFREPQDRDSLEKLVLRTQDTAFAAHDIKNTTYNGIVHSRNTAPEISGKMKQFIRTSKVPHTP